MPKFDGSNITELPQIVISRILRAGANADPADVETLKKSWGGDVFVPTPDDIEKLIPILHTLGEYEFLDEVCPHEYLDWQFQDDDDAPVPRVAQDNSIEHDSEV